MKKTLFIMLLASSMAMQAQTIKLPAPAKKGGTSTVEALWNRHSTRSFQNKELSRETLSNLLWAANGINRSDGKRTNPSAMNKQEITVYAFMKDGVYRHDYKAHSLVKIKSGDYRSLVAHGQPYVNDAPVSLVIVADADAMSVIKNTTDRLMMVSADAGIVSQNINIYCAANGLATVPRANMDKKAIKELLGLSENSMPIMNNPVGYAK